MVNGTRPEVAPGTMRLIRGVPNPNGAQETSLFLLAGDPAREAIREIIPGEGVKLPPKDRVNLPFRLRILHFNDLHGQVSRSTAYGNHAILARMVWWVRELRRLSSEDARQAVLFLSGGDDLVGNELGELLVKDSSPGGSPAIHACYHLYSAAGVDVGVVGNHDLNLGTDILARAIERDARFPVVAANLQAKAPLAGRIYPGVLLVVKGLRVGIVGLTTPGEIVCPDRSNMIVVHPLTTIQNLVPALEPLCDVLIILSHLGRSLVSSTATTRDAGDVELASSLPHGSVHLIVGGHTHEALNESGLSVANLVNGVPIVQAGTRGRFLGEVEITVAPGQFSRSMVHVGNVHLTATADFPVDEDFEREQIQPLLERVAPLIARRLGRVANHPDLTVDAVRYRFAADESALANFVTDALVSRCRAAGYPVDIAAIDASALHDGLPVGRELSFGDWFRVMPFADTIRIYQVTGQQLLALLNDNALRADRPDEPHVERGFLQFSQLVRYTIDRGEDRNESCAIDILVEDRPLDQQLERSFLVACTSFVRETAGPWERQAGQGLGLRGQAVPGTLYADTGLPVRAAVAAYIRAHGGVTEVGGVQRDGRLNFSHKESESTS